ncbi:MAG: hypothetical protein IIC79_06290 [Chloroflexi bacterium]|nr:hypothetical protein [Chloroflexota bacterium]
MMKKLLPILMLAAFIIPVQISAAPRLGVGLSVTVPGGPRFWVANVVRNKSVTLRVENYDKVDKYTFSLGNIGAAFGEGIKVGVIDKTFPKNFSVTYDLPSRLIGDRLLGVQLRNNITRARAYDIFENTTGWNSTMALTLNPDSSSSGDSGGNSVSILGGPTFWVHDVNPRKTVTIKVMDYPKFEKYKVTMGEVGGELSPGIPVGLLDGSSGRDFTITFAIPSGLWDDPELFIRLENSFTQNFGYTGFTQTDPWAPVYLGPSPGFSTSSGVSSGYTSGIPFTSILNVVADSEVTLQTFNLPAGKDFIVTMGLIGTRGIGGTVVAIQSSGAGGSLIATYAIPPALAGSDMISIRLQSTSSGHYAYNYFFNSDGNVPVYTSTTSSGTTTTTSSSVPILPLGLYPTFSVPAVSEDNSVTITTFNLAPADSYMVFIGAYGTLGIGGIMVDTLDAGAGGTMSVTFSIPPEMYGVDRLAIRLESSISGYFAYNWFWNQDYP